eukprot:augustus_masked-scaffold_52-processed-gene-1.23-mRNA-1 protein AED:0.85 eAED:1.00 QI:0/-1/0/1/-1/1/1/0/337
MPDREIIYLLVYVDDILFATNSQKNGNVILRKLQSAYDIKVTQKATKFIGFEFNQLKHGVLINVEKYIEAITKTYDCENTKEQKTPHEPGKYHSPEGNKIEEKLYQRIIGAVHFIAETCRPDIAYAVNRLAVFTKEPTLQLLKEAKKIIKYLNYTKEYGLYYKKNTRKCEIRIYSDTSWGNVPGDRSSLDGHLITLNNTPISWKSKKQNIIAKSSTEAELVGITRALSSAEWLKNILNFLEIRNVTWSIKSDSMPAIKLLQGQSLTDSSRHMELKYFFSRIIIKRNKWSLVYLERGKNPADVFTKPVKEYIFKRMRKYLVVSSKEAIEKENKEVLYI